MLSFSDSILQIKEIEMNIWPLDLTDVLLAGILLEGLFISYQIVKMKWRI